MRHCVAHCTVCDRHFSGMEAFDCHRHGSYDPMGRHCEAPRHLVDRHGEPVMTSFEGACGMGPEVETGVTIWTRDR